MSTATESTVLAALPAERSRLADYAELTKPRIAVMVLFTVAAGAWLAGRGAVDPLLLFNAVFGTGLVAAGASVLNQLLERHTDARMRRTENRPLPSGRVQPVEAAVLGLALAAAGLAYLAVTVRQPLTVLLAAVTFVSYVWVYTPLKRYTTLNTLIGAVPGALPPVIGASAVDGAIGFEALLLFAVIFLWQVPHFYAIAWIYRDDYARAGMKMLPVTDRGGAVTGWQMVLFCLALLAVSVAPAFTGDASPLSAALCGALGLMFLAAAVAFLRERTNRRARAVLRVSLVYLPLLLACLLLTAGN
jgi:protoheme IX farnesyltransferase